MSPAAATKAKPRGRSRAKAKPAGAKAPLVAAAAAERQLETFIDSPTEKPCDSPLSMAAAANGIGIAKQRARRRSA